jgi:transcription antitermination factor NusG
VKKFKTIEQLKKEIKPRKITKEDAEGIKEILSFLTSILLAAGIEELKISKKEKIIYFDVGDSQEINPDHLDNFNGVIEDLYFDTLEN